MAEKLNTTQLLNNLLQTRNIGRFFNRYDNELNTEPFCEYLKNLCKEKGCLPAHIIKNSGIDRTFAHQIFNGTKKPSRDKVLHLAFAFEMNLAEAQTLLKKAKKFALSTRIKRDAAVMFALEKRLDITGVQSMLFELEIPVLGEEKYHE